MMSFISRLQPAKDRDRVVNRWLANEHWLSHHANHDERSFVHPTATVAPGVRLIDSVVGASARIDGAGTVERSVIWPGAATAAPLLDTVVTPRARASR